MVKSPNETSKTPDRHRVVDHEETFRRDLSATYVPIGDLVPNDQNARTHSRRQIRQIADSIETFGWTNPILVDASGNIIAGHGRKLGAEYLGIEEVPVIRIEGLSEAEKRAYVLADNKLAENAGWDRDLLRLELGELIDLDVDVTLTGFEMGEIDLIVQDAGDGGDDDAEVSPEIDLEATSVSRPGDLWLIGPHRLYCGDARELSAYERLLDGELARMVFTDPPYNVEIDGNVSGLGQNRHREFVMASGEMSESEFLQFLEKTLGQMAAHSSDGAIHFVCMDWRHMDVLLAAGKAVYPELKNICVWNKTNAGMGTLYRSKHEFIAVFKSGRGPHVNNIELGRHGRHRANVWDYAGATVPGRRRDEELAMHPTVKPVAMVADAILDCSDRGDLVLDAFGGAGTTILAAARTGRRAAVMELDPTYVDATIRRMADVICMETVHAESGRTFAEIAQERATGDALKVRRTGA